MISFELRSRFSIQSNHYRPVSCIFLVAQSLGSSLRCPSESNFCIFNMEYFLQFLPCCKFFLTPLTFPNVFVHHLLSFCCKSQGNLAHIHELNFHCCDDLFPIMPPSTTEKYTINLLFAPQTSVTHLCFTPEIPFHQS